MCKHSRFCLSEYMNLKIETLHCSPYTCRFNCTILPCITDGKISDSGLLSYVRFSEAHILHLLYEFLFVNVHLEQDQSVTKTRS